MTKDFEFTSDKFLPYLPEDCQGNPGVYGFELALWVSQMLAQAGVPTSYPMGEDWGWFIEHKMEGAACMIACSSMCDEGDGYTGQPIYWRIGVEERASRGMFFRRKAGPAESATADRLAGLISDLLKREGITVRESQASRE